MRLIDTETGSLREFIGRSVPIYAILSHTWVEGEEVTYQEYIAGSSKHKQGYQKILRACQLAKLDKIAYVWVDTCCIDKTSSAELSEAINSMYRWYERSMVCYVFLQDFERDEDYQTDEQVEYSLGDCRWFTRGWTLQELIAPRNVVFYDSAYRYYSTKLMLAIQISRITRIDIMLLQYERPLSNFSVAQKLSWASKRKTTRIEDEAYCLLGLFDLNMPLLYGEEEKAFRRLQEEIIRNNTDLSIFAWAAGTYAATIHGYLDHDKSREMLCGVLAASPKEFSECHRFSKVGGDVREFSTSNVGIKTRLRLLLDLADESEAPRSRNILPLNCKCDDLHLGIYVRKIGQGKFLRQDPLKVVKFRLDTASWTRLKERNFLTQIPNPSLDFSPRFQKVSRVLSQLRSSAVKFTTISRMFIKVNWPSAQWDPLDRVFFQSGDTHQDFCVASCFLPYEFCEQARWSCPSSPVIRVCAFIGPSDRPERAQFGLVEESLYGRKMDEVQKLWNEEDALAVHVIEHVRHRHIPKTNTVIYDPHGEGPVAVLNLTAQRVKDPEISVGNVWKIHTSCQMSERGKAPQPDGKQWETM